MAAEYINQLRIFTLQKPGQLSPIVFNGRFSEVERVHGTGIRGAAASPVPWVSIKRNTLERSWKLEAPGLWRKANAKNITRSESQC